MLRAKHGVMGPPLPSEQIRNMRANNVRREPVEDMAAKMTMSSPASELSGSARKACPVSPFRVNQLADHARHTTFTSLVTPKPKSLSPRNCRSAGALRSLRHRGRRTAVRRCVQAVSSACASSTSRSCSNPRALEPCCRIHPAGDRYPPQGRYVPGSASRQSEPDDQERDQAS
jgi:hypothetical protein